MMKKSLVLFIAGCVCLATQGCTWQGFYEGFKEKERQDCYKLKSEREIQECLEKTNSMTYDQYEKARENPNK